GVNGHHPLETLTRKLTALLQELFPFRSTDFPVSVLVDPDEEEFQRQFRARYVRPLEHIQIGRKLVPADLTVAILVVLLEHDIKRRRLVHLAFDTAKPVGSDKHTSAAKNRRAACRRCGAD